MASAEPDLPHNKLRDIIIIDSSDTEVDEPPSLPREPREPREKRPCTDDSYPAHEALFDNLVSLEASETSQPRKKHKISSLDMVLETANQKIHEVWEAEHAKMKNPEEKVQHLLVEMIRKDEQISELEAKIRELEHRCQCSICYTIPLEWKTLLCGHRFCSQCLSSDAMTCGSCRQNITGYIKSY
ncbi:uncharacterized protein BDCG_07543 [Blastomyces dermatitidis ER-3]|uniref:RING-type domain-containing protein n=3 Tax=Blastomyces TaxID=229219 RepID=A0A179UHA7_BLAGS|nr:uncharacterized protein BDBG_03229 [Blastomyces gilchristii SLH14081]XP_045278748.1 uncharacterized protein BDCG_07543 [Blastomyces dermatitidis ER-3]EGE84043.1 hypothetical protein BDDG_06988 [Blastomyces dermatitidis ATCC 18188]EQL35124.1 hypothetical protein BDFG_03110 [Blastomyces dermatitidis ATCC 26199]EEQ92423.1 hypothetical protein BDCG_07543 [Blastomyces dermatitidis ER-3]OAT07133.1 hypothetical protein BDBG_03229 [Blastomyces gilchristii SLH14081]